MNLSNDTNMTAMQEFASLEQVLNQSADDAARCLKLLKKNLSEYDSRHGNHFINTATSYMRTDMRNAKDTTEDLKHVAHKINRCSQPSKSEIAVARNMMDAAAKAMDILNTTARDYDQKNGRSKGVKGTIDNAVGKNDHERSETHTGLFGKDEEGKSTGLLGKSDDHHHHHHGLGSDTVEELTKKTLQENFNLRALSRQISIAEKSLSTTPSFVERAKEAVNQVLDKLTDDNASPTHGAHHTGKHAITP